MSVISIKFNEEEEKVIKKFIESKGFSVSQYIKDLIFEKIEDEYDLEIYKEYLKEKEEGKLVTIPFEEAAKEWDLE